MLSKVDLPAPGGAHDGDELALLNLAGDAPEHVAAAEAAFVEFFEVAENDHCLFDYPNSLMPERGHRVERHGAPRGQIGRENGDSG